MGAENVHRCEPGSPHATLACLFGLSLAAISVGCAEGTVVSPGASMSIVAPSPTAEPAPSPSSAVTVSGPRGCVDAATLPRVIAWTIENVPPNARFLKAYHHDEEPTCEPTESERRTENDHLRVISTGPTTARAEYDVFTYGCGRQQVDISIQIGTAEPQLLVGMVIYHRGQVCSPPPPPAPPPPPPPPPAPPLPPTVPCDVQHPRELSGSGSVTIAQNQSQQKQARVSASYRAGNFTGRVGIYWRNNGSTYMKTSRAVNVPCGQQGSGALSWSSDWVSPSHGHVNSGARYYLVFYTGSDSSPNIVWERQL
jgi:hypothetical protein